MFLLDAAGNETTLYNFPGELSNNPSPVGALVSDSRGNLYGTTWEGGAETGGMVFKVDSAGKETVLHVFTGTDGDGYLSKAGLVIDKHGNLYGTTINGGASGSGFAGDGTVFKVDSEGNESVLHSFTGTGGDGAHPYASLVLDAEGNLYGTTYGGGYLGCQPPYGCGTVFKIDPTGNETTLYSFTGKAPDYGQNPVGGLGETRKVICMALHPTVATLPTSEMYLSWNRPEHNRSPGLHRSRRRWRISRYKSNARPTGQSIWHDQLWRSIWVPMAVWFRLRNGVQTE